MKKILLTILFVSPAAFVQAQSASDGLAPYMEYRKRIESTQNIAPLDNGIFGDKFNLYNGNTFFETVDVDLPGNNALPIQLGRRFSVAMQPQYVIPYDTLLHGVGNWDIDIPYVAATYPDDIGWSAQRCTSDNTPPLIVKEFNLLEFWNGITVHIPQKADAIVLASGLSEIPHPSNGMQYYWTTVNRDAFDCIPMKSGLAGEGFRMTTTSGLRYYFDISIIRKDSTLKKMVQNSLTGSPKQTLLNRTRYYLLASKMEDQFGNTVQYQYDSSGYPTRIWSDDGREIVLNYAGGRLSTVAAHGKIWSYQYSSEGNLTSVTLPDGSLWQYDYTGNLRPNAPVSPEGQSNNVWCQDEPYLPNWTYQIVITHPGGAHGLFKFLNRRHYRSGVHLSGCEQDWPVVFSGPSDQPTYTLLIPNFFDVMSLGSKTISGTGLSTMAWNYDYGVVPVGLWGTLGVQGTYPCTTCQQYKTVTVTNPDGTKTRQKYGIQYWFNDGRLLQMETVSASGVVVRTETNEYLADADAPVQAFYGEYGAIGSFADPGSVWIRPMVKRSIIQQGRTFNWEVAKACAVGSVTTYCFDTYARPTKVTTSSAPSP